VARRCHVMNEWAEFVTSWSRDRGGRTLYGMYRYAFSRLLAEGLVNSLTFVDTTGALDVAADATRPCDDNALNDACQQQTTVSSAVL